MHNVLKQAFLLDRAINDANSSSRIHSNRICKLTEIIAMKMAFLAVESQRHIFFIFRQDYTPEFDS